MADYDQELEDTLTEEEKEERRLEQEMLESLAHSIDSKFRTRSSKRAHKEQ